MILNSLTMISFNNTSSIFISKDFPGMLMPVSEYSMCATNLHIVLDLLNVKKPNLVVELGSGISTILAAYWLKEHKKGEIISFEHSNKWAEKCSFYLKYHGLEDIAEVRSVPLGFCKLLDHELNWYQLDNKIQDMRDIDILIVDGPPADKNPLARLPALPKFYDLLKNDALIFLDDGNRDGERRIVKEWCDSFSDFKAEYFDTLTGCWILKRDSLKNEPLNKENKTKTGKKEM